MEMHVLWNIYVNFIIASVLAKFVILNWMLEL